MSNLRKNRHENDDLIEEEYESNEIIKHDDEGLKDPLPDRSEQSKLTVKDIDWKEEVKRAVDEGIIVGSYSIKYLETELNKLKEQDDQTSQLSAGEKQITLASVYAKKGNYTKSRQYLRESMARFAKAGVRDIVDVLDNVFKETCTTRMEAEELRLIANDADKNVQAIIEEMNRRDCTLTESSLFKQLSMTLPKSKYLVELRKHWKQVKDARTKDDKDKKGKTMEKTASFLMTQIRGLSLVDDIDKEQYGIDRLIAAPDMTLSRIHVHLSSIVAVSAKNEESRVEKEEISKFIHDIERVRNKGNAIEIGIVLSYEGIASEWPWWTGKGHGRLYVINALDSNIHILDFNSKDIELILSGDIDIMTLIDRKLTWLIRLRKELKKAKRDEDEKKKILKTALPKIGQDYKFDINGHSK